MRKVAITGNIGAGKSYVSQMFALLGVPIFYADDEAKKVLRESKPIQKKINDLTDGKAFPDSGVMNRDLIFSVLIREGDEYADAITQDIHRLTTARFEQWANAIQANSLLLPYCIKEAALIYESKVPQHLDWVIGVDCPLAIRRQRYLQRAGSSIDNFSLIESRQIDATIKMKLADSVIQNSGTEALLPQVLDVHERLKKK